MIKFRDLEISPIQITYTQIVNNINKRKMFKRSAVAFNFIFYFLLSCFFITGLVMIQQPSSRLAANGAVFDAFMKSCQRL